MERSREARKLNLTQSNGLPRRRQRGAGIRDSPEEMEVQETVRLRERGSKRERDSVSRRKRKRGDKHLRESNGEDGEGSTEESFGEEDDYEAEQSNRKVSPSVRGARQSPTFKVAEEMIGVSVPRKARSASVKRSYEYWVPGNGGLGEEHNHGRVLNSPASRMVESERLSPPPPSGVSVRKKMKPNGPKTRFSKVSKSSSTVQEDIEIEVAEVLYGLMKQSQSSKKDDSESSSQKPEYNEENRTCHDTKPSISSSAASSVRTHSKNSSLAHRDRPDSDSLSDALEKMEAENSSALYHHNTLPSTLKVESELSEKVEIPPLNSEKLSDFSVENGEANIESGASAAASGSQENLAIRRKDSKLSVEEMKCEDGTSAKERTVLKDEEMAKVDVDLQDSNLTKATPTFSDVESHREEKFKIDLMAPPPMVSSPERDNSIDLASDLNKEALDLEITKASVKNDVKVAEDVGLVRHYEAKKADATRERRELLKLDMEKSHQDGGYSTGSKLEQHGQKHLPKSSIVPKVEKAAQPNSLPLPITLASWQNGLSPLGCVPPFQVIAPRNTGGSSTPLQPPNFRLSQPRPKRCGTHRDVAYNIQLQQHLIKTRFWPAIVNSASPVGAKPISLNVMPSADNLVLGNAMPRSFFAANLNSSEVKGQTVGNFPGLARKDKSSDSHSPTAKKKHLEFQQAPQQVQAGNVMPPPTFIYPLCQNQSTATANQQGDFKGASSSSKLSLSDSSTAVTSSGAAAIPGMATAVSFNYSNLGANESAYMTILPSNSYPFAISAPIGNTPAIRGNLAQAMPFFNGSFYASQMFHPQLQQQQQKLQSQPQIQQTHQNASTSTGASSSLKQPEGQQPRGVQVAAGNLLSSTSVHAQPVQKYHALSSNQSSKLGSEMNGENKILIPHFQKNVNSQNAGPSPQQLNFTLAPSTSAGGNGGGSSSEKQQQIQQKNIKGGVDMGHSQAFAMSFSSFPGNSIASNLNFSSMAHNPANFHNLPGISRQGYQVAPVSQASQLKNHQIPDGKRGGASTYGDDGKKPTLAKSHAINGQTIVFDHPARTSFVSGNWMPCSVPSSTVASSPVVGANPLNSQQQQLLQHQKQQTLHQQHPPSAGRDKAQASNTGPASSAAAAKYSSNVAVFTQNPAQSNTITQSVQRKNSARIPSSQVPSTSLAASNVSILRNLPQQPVKAQGQTHISFGGNSIPSSRQGQVPTSSQSTSPLLVGSPSSGGSFKTGSTGTKVTSLVTSQQSENSSTGTGQKSSPVCGRNVPSILSTCPSHLSELKY